MFSLQLLYIKTFFESQNNIPYAKIYLYDIKVNNLNTGFYKDLDTNFEIACELSEQNL